MASKMVNETSSSSNWLWHGALAAIGAGLSFGLLALAFTSFEKDQAGSQGCSDDVHEQKRSGGTRCSSYRGNVAEDRKEASSSQTSPQLDSEDSGISLQRKCISRTAGRMQPTSPTCSSEPYCGSTADWKERPLQGSSRSFHSNVPVISLMSHQASTATTSLGTSRALSGRKSAPVASTNRQTLVKLNGMARERRSFPPMAKKEESSEIDLSCAEPVTIWRRPSNETMTSLSIKLSSSSETNHSQTTDNSSPSVSPKRSPISPPVGIKVTVDPKCVENTLSMLALVSIPEIFEIVKKFSLDANVNDVAQQLQVLCNQLTSPPSRVASKNSLDASCLASILSFDALGVTWDSILHALTRKIRENSGLKPKYVNHLFGMKVTTLNECKTCDAAQVVEDKLCWAFPITTDFVGTSTVRYTLLSCLKKKCDSVKVRGDNWTKCRHSGNLYQKTVVTAFPDVLVFERTPQKSSVHFPSFPIKLDLSTVARCKEFRPRYRLHAVTLGSSDDSGLVYFRFNGSWLTVDENGKLKRVRLVGSEEKFHAERLMLPSSVTHVIYIRELLGGVNPPFGLSNNFGNC